MAVALSPLDQKIAKLIRTAEDEMEDLVRVIRPAVKNMHLREVDLDKGVKAMKRALAFMDGASDITKVQGSPIYKQLSPLMQVQVDWMHKVLVEILKLQDRLLVAKKQLQFDTEQKFKVLLKSIKDIFALMPNAPRGTGPWIKEIQKGVDKKSPEYALIPVLPMALLLFAIMDSVLRGQKAKPKV